VIIVTKQDNTKYWIIVVSRDHVQKGVEEGICQISHGKDAALKRMSEGDWIVFYSPKERFDGVEKCRKFTALGRIKDDRIYQVNTDADFHPFRRNVNFLAINETSIEPLISKLSFIKSKKSWGYVFRFGLVEIPRKDFLAIASRMLPAYWKIV
jgi:predicted RNA-binding protein